MRRVKQKNKMNVLRATAERLVENPRTPQDVKALAEHWLKGNPKPRELPAMTERQQDVLDYFRDYFDKNRTNPTVREIGSELGIRSPNGVTCHLKALGKKGVLEQRGEQLARGWGIAKAYQNS